MCVDSTLINLPVLYLHTCMILQAHGADRRESAMWNRVQTTSTYTFASGTKVWFHAVTPNEGSTPARRESLHGQHVKTAGYAPGLKAWELLPKVIWWTIFGIKNAFRTVRDSNAQYDYFAIRTSCLFVCTSWSLGDECWNQRRAIHRGWLTDFHIRPSYMLRGHAVGQDRPRPMGEGSYMQVATVCVRMEYKNVQWQLGDSLREK